MKQKERGQSLVEYALILVLIAVVVIAALSILGSTIENVFGTVLEKLRAAGCTSKFCEGDWLPSGRAALSVVLSFV